MAGTRIARVPMAEQIRLINECRQSGMTDADWCRENDIAVSTFYNWVSRCRKAAADQIPAANYGHLEVPPPKQDVVPIDIVPDHVPEQHTALQMQNQQQIEIIHGVQHKKVVCILDEAHLLEKETLEEFRFLLNYRFDSMSPMAVVLVGQTELWDHKLKLQRYAAIRQRIDMYCTLPHMDRADTEKYIKSHMDYAQCNQEVFTSKALDEIHKASTGIPRIVNRVCEKSLMYAFQKQKRLIDDYMVKYVVEHEMLGTIAG